MGWQSTFTHLPRFPLYGQVFWALARRGHPVRRVVSLKLVDPPEDKLEVTAEAFRQACQVVGNRLRLGELRPNAYLLRSATYADLNFLPSQMRCNVSRVVAGAWKSWKSNGCKGKPPTFSRSWVPYSEGRDWSLRPGGVVSIRTLSCRVKLEYRTSPLGQERLGRALGCGGLGGALLIRKRKGWFLNVTIALPDTPVSSPLTPIGIDRGIAYTPVARAPNAQPLMIRGNRLRHYCDHYRGVRRRLQRKGTRSARRLLQRLSGREKRFVLDQARVAARNICRYALGFERPILVLEALYGIREDLYETSLRKGKRYRYLLNAWAYRILLNAMIAAVEELGIPYVLVSPAWTSRTCPRCGDAREGNRSGVVFHCLHCGYKNHADVVGATNLARRWLQEHAQQPWGRVNGPDGWGEGDQVPEVGCPLLDAQAIL